ncbi:galactose mutarotase [Candidatus Bathyarchaeota archaeon]|nr:galactose mutarotase [Candidatus Bathyarchaeota archaeon]MBT7187551.1 galactose mutarotase [Candidatus Bathyarchaeota archaeon]
METTSEPWGITPSGERVKLFTLSDEITVKISNYGGTIVSIQAPDRSGRMGEVTLGFNTVDGYINSDFYLGATIGRYANRIANGEFYIDGEAYKLAQNNGPNHLHGGIKGYDKVVWDAELLESGLRLSYRSTDMEEGYPGTLEASITFTLREDRLELDYLAVTDNPTVVNLTNHAYFNLAGGGSVLRHRLWIDSDRYSPVGENMIPLGKHDVVEGTPFDFREATEVGGRINDGHVQLERGGGYDHNYVLNQISNPQIRVTEPESGRTLEVSTTMPGVQFYTGNFLDGSDKGRNGPINRRSGLCLETQFFPDSPNQPDFPSTILRPCEKYIEKTVYRFTTES